MTEEAAVEETFISHLVELRDRLVKASIGIAIACAALFIWPGPSQVYDLLVHLVQHRDRVDHSLFMPRVNWRRTRNDRREPEALPEPPADVPLKSRT